MTQKHFFTSRDKTESKKMFYCLCYAKLMDKELLFHFYVAFFCYRIEPKLGDNFWSLNVSEFLQKEDL